MNLQEQVYSVLVVSASDTFNASLTSLLPETKFDPIRTETSVNAARRALSDRNYDFIIINSPLPDDSGIRFAIDLSGLKTSVALLMVRSDIYEEMYNKVAEYGVYVLAKPTSKPIVSQAIDWMIATRERLKKFEKKTMSTEEKMQEIRIVNHAKWTLIEQLKMTEADAHRYIEKQAMDYCISKREMAEKIIKTYS
ncbi:MAG: ANTAR domain-containing protein [Oscillospiraceae bacterium]|nr:ANTAR domain-containing protein [Oscillospiraceae bacterium]